MKYTRRGRYLDSENGKWTICKDYVTNTYTLLNNETHEYIKENDGVLVRQWGYLKDVKNYIENWA